MIDLRYGGGGRTQTNVETFLNSGVYTMNGRKKRGLEDVRRAVAEGAASEPAQPVPADQEPPPSGAFPPAPLAATPQPPPESPEGASGEHEDPDQGPPEPAGTEEEGGLEEVFGLPEDAEDPLRKLEQQLTEVRTAAEKAVADLASRVEQLEARIEKQNLPEPPRSRREVLYAQHPTARRYGMILGLLLLGGRDGGVYLADRFVEAAERRNPLLKDRETGK